MDQKQTYRIETEAAQELARWKAVFAEQVAIEARKLADKDVSTDVITLGHYRHAARIAVQTLAIAVQDTGSHDGRQEAA